MALSSSQRRAPQRAGTVRQLPSGRFQAFYRREGETFTGPATFATRPEAEAWLAAERAARARGDWVHPRLLKGLTVSAAFLTSVTPFSALCEVLVAEEWKYAETRPSTLHEQERLIRHVILPSLGQVPIGAIKPSLLDAAYQGWWEHSPSQARNALVALRKIIKLGKRRDLFTFDMAEGIRTHPRPERPIVALEPMHLDELRRVIDQWRSRPHRRGPEPTTLLQDVVNVMLATSARIGEALGLRAQDISFGTTGTVVHIAGTLVEGHGQRKHWQAATKTEAGMRSIIVPDWIVSTFERLVLTANVDCTDYLFHTSSGAPTGAHAVHRQLRAVRQWAGLSNELVPHVLRKTVATAIANHESGGLEAAALTLGHARSRVTENHYAKRRTLAPDMRVVLDLLGPERPAR
jgi:integrase